MAWHLNALASLHWRSWDNEWVVFDVGSGQTHHMDSLTAFTLMSIEAAPVLLSDLESRVSEELHLPNDQELSKTLNGVLERLAAVGLIESTGP